jgi:death on curing protein
MKTPRWVSRRVLVLAHTESIAEYRGVAGIRDEGRLDSALARTGNRFAYQRKCDLADLAAAYAFGLSQNHPFRDGNKRIAFLAAGLFLELNGVELTSDPLAEITTFLSLASGALSERGLAQWIRENSRPTRAKES